MTRGRGWLAIACLILVLLGLLLFLLLCGPSTVALLYEKSRSRQEAVSEKDMITRPKPGQLGLPTRVRPFLRDSDKIKDFQMRGRILSADGNRPIQGAEIRACESWECLKIIAAASDLDGNYQLSFQFNGQERRYLTVAKPGFVGQRGVLSIKSAGIIEKDYLLQEAVSDLKGRVVDDARNPVARAMVSIQPVGAGHPRTDNAFGSASSYPSEFRTSTSDKGEFIAEGLPVGPAVIRAFAPRYLQADRPGTEAHLKPGTNIVEIEMETGQTLSLRVRNSELEAIPGAFASVFSPERRGFRTGCTTDRAGEQTSLSLSW